MIGVEVVRTVDDFINIDNLEEVRYYDNNYMHRSGIEFAYRSNKYYEFFKKSDKISIYMINKKTNSYDIEFLDEGMRRHLANSIGYDYDHDGGDRFGLIGEAIKDITFDSDYDCYYNKNGRIPWYSGWAMEFHNDIDSDPGYHPKVKQSEFQDKNRSEYKICSTTQNQ